MDNLDKKIEQIVYGVRKNVFIPEEPLRIIQAREFEAMDGIKSLLRECLEGVVPKRSNDDAWDAETQPYVKGLMVGSNQTIDEIRSNSKKMLGEV